MPVLYPLVCFPRNLNLFSYLHSSFISVGEIQAVEEMTPISIGKDSEGKKKGGGRWGCIAHLNIKV